MSGMGCRGGTSGWAGKRPESSPVSSGSVPLKGERRMVPLDSAAGKYSFTMIISNRGAVDKFSGGVDAANPESRLARPMHRHEPQEGVNRFGDGDKADGPQLGEG